MIISVMLQSLLNTKKSNVVIIQIEMSNKRTEGMKKINIDAKVKYVAKNHYIASTTQNKTEVIKISPEKSKPKRTIYPKTNEYNFSTEGSNKEFSCDNSVQNFQGEDNIGKKSKTQKYVQKHTHQKARHFTPVQHSKLFSVTRNVNIFEDIQQEKFSQFGVNLKSNTLPREYLGINARKVLYEQQRPRDRDRDDTMRRPRTKCIEKIEEKIVHIEDDSEEEKDNQSIRKELFNFIIHESLSFKLPNKIFIKKEFRDTEHYMKTLMPLVKEQISATIIQTIQKMEERSQRDYLKVSLSRTGRSNSHFKDNDQLQITTNQREQKILKSILLKGACLGLITKSLPISKERLISHDGQSYLCLVRVQNLTGRTTVDGLDDLPEIFKEPNQRQNYGKFQANYLKQNQFYFVDLTPITSFQREYIAISRALQSPLIQTIVNSTSIPQQKSKLKQRKQSLQSTVFSQIKRKLNPSQVQAIKTVFQNDTGIYLIQGPPGTGKTECITNLIALQYDHQLSTKQNKKILVCAQSNAAVDHIARKIMKKGLIGSNLQPQILKLGAEDSVWEEGLDINLRHICQIDVLDIAGKADKWSVSLMSQFQKLKEQLQKQKQRGANFNELKSLQMKLNKVVAQLQKNKKDLAKNKSKVEIIQREHVDRCQIIFSTLNTSGNVDILSLVKDQIACVIIDEASQATEPSTLIPLLTGVKKMILVGDHMQLQPTVMSKKAKKTQYSRSLFERLVHCGVKPHLLNIQYRMHPQLNRFSSMYFYDNRVKNGSKLSTPKSLLKMKNAALLIDLQYTKQGNRNKSFYNETEALCINKFVKMLLKEDYDLEIGIISPYAEQIKLIQQGLQKQLGANRQQVNIRVSTVDAFQGQEVDVVIFSCVRANDISKIGFVQDKKRLNVAITRAKHAAVIFGNMNTFKHDETWKAYIDHHNSQKTLKTASNVKSCLEALQGNIFGQARQNIKS